MRRNGEDGCLAQRDVDCFAAGLCFVSLRGDAVLCIRRDVKGVVGGWGGGVCSVGKRGAVGFVLGWNGVYGSELSLSSSQPSAASE